MKLTDAVESGAIAAFSEKYGEMVRVIDVPGVSRELCGGTHVDNIHRLYPFKILNETSVAAGKCFLLPSGLNIVLQTEGLRIFMI